MLVDLIQLLRDRSKRSPLWWIGWTVVFLAIAVAHLIDGPLWIGLLWIPGALIGLVGLVIVTTQGHSPQ